MTEFSHRLGRCVCAEGKLALQVLSKGRCELSPQACQQQDEQGSDFSQDQMSLKR
jgi:hypothetical protein